MCTELSGRGTGRRSALRTRSPLCEGHRDADINARALPLSLNSDRRDKLLMAKAPRQQNAGSEPGLLAAEPTASPHSQPSNRRGGPPAAKKFNSALQNYMGGTSGQRLKRHNLEELNSVTFVSG